MIFCSNLSTQPVRKNITKQKINDAKSCFNVNYLANIRRTVSEAKLNTANFLLYFCNFSSFLIKHAELHIASDDSCHLRYSRFSFVLKVILISFDH